MASSAIVKLNTLTYGGETMGRLPDGRAVFVPFTLPGETVRISLVEEKKGFARADLLEILEPSSRRILPRCAHYQVCGGCQYQHMAYADQHQAKADIVRDQLMRIGKLVDPPVRPLISAPSPWNYRNHVQFHLDNQGKLGYKAAGSSQVVAIRECHLPVDALNQIWPLLDFEALPGLDRVGLRLGAEDEVQLILESRDPSPPEFSVEDLPISAVHLSPAGAVVLAGSESLVMEVKGCYYRVSAGSFFQVNTLMAAALVDGLLKGLSEYTTLNHASTVLDVYSGAGLFSGFLAPQVGRLVAIEASPSAVEDFSASLDEFDNVEIYEAPAEAVLPALDIRRPQAIIVDPPRAGLERSALDAILAMQPEVLAYVSCDPSTLARDARRLAENGYILRSLTPYDLFPQTYHIESLSFWTQENS
jgi:23S rRNA (uracil1939-C5)-methyltransferase